MSNATKIEFSASDTVGVILGDRRSGKSTLCNRLCTTVDIPQDGRDVADVLDITDEPCVYNLKNSEHGKILDVPNYRSEEFPDEDMASFAARNHLHRADYVILSWSHRSLPPDDYFSWCEDNEKPVLCVMHWTMDTTRHVMREEKCSQSEAETQIRQLTRELKDAMIETGVPHFLIDTEQWQTAIVAYEAGDYDAAQLHNDEGELSSL